MEPPGITIMIDGLDRLFEQVRRSWFRWWRNLSRMVHGVARLPPIDFAVSEIAPAPGQYLGNAQAGHLGAVAVGGKIPDQRADAASGGGVGVIQ